jgi:O-antigen/teichoic acid export membrane protein
MSDPDPWRKHFWRNTATNYLSTIVRMATGIVLFRLLFQHLTREQFGYYSLLWSLFGYAILLDFGLGFSVQKVVAQKSTIGDIGAINRLVSTIFWTFSGLATALLILFAAIQPWFLAWIKVAPSSRPEFGAAYLVFFAAMAFNFPIALFPEMLRGLHRLDVVNWTFIASQALNLFLMVWALFAHWAFPVVVLISVTTTAAPNLAAYFIARRFLPGLSLHPRNFHFPEVRGILSFSLVAYLITFTNLIMLRADQGVISVTVGVTFVAIYQVGYKAAEMFGLFSKQLQEALSPAAAHLGGQKDQAGICNLLFQSSRFTILLTTPLYALCAVYLEPVIKILSGLKQVDHSTFWVGQSLLIATYSSMLTNSCPKRILVMCGWEKQLLKVSATDAALNFLLSLILVYPLGVLGVAVGTLIPTVLVGWLWMLPLTAKFTGRSSFAVLKEYIQPILGPVAASLAVLALLVVLFGAPSGFIGCAWRGALVFGTVLYFGRPHFRSLLSKPAPAPAAGLPVTPLVAPPAPAIS